MEVPALGSAQARLREDLRKQEAPEAAEAVTAFLIWITPDGRYVMSTDLGYPVTAGRAPTRQEVIAACEVTAGDMRRQAQTEELTMNILGNLSRMQADPQYHMAIEQARAQAGAAAAAAANGNALR